MTVRNANLLVLLAAFVSGFSIFLNKFAVSGANPFVFTALKNIAVAVFLFSAIFLLRDFSSLKKLSKKAWLQLAAIGLVGGSAPFLLFFFALSQTSAINAGFLHKTIFVFASLFAFALLKEKITRRFAFAASLLLAGNCLLFSRLSSFGFADALVLLAVLLWAIESVVAKRVLRQLDGKTVGFGRMFFGSAFMLLFLLATGQIQQVFFQPIENLEWVLLASAPLFFYVLFFFSALKEMPVHRATALLMLGQPITALLSMVFLSQTLSFSEALGVLLTLFGVLLLVGFGFFLKFAKANKSIFRPGAGNV